MTQQNAALVEESAAAAESLKGQALQLVQAVAVFKLPNNGQSAARPASKSKAPPKPATPAAARAPATIRAKVNAEDWSSF